MATTRVMNAGGSANSKSGLVVIEQVLDATQILASDLTVAGYAANDVYTMALPAGVGFISGLIYTDTAWTGVIDIGIGAKAADSTNILNGGTPGAAGIAISMATLLNVTTTQIGNLTTVGATNYLNITIKSANTTGKITVSLLAHVCTRAMAG